MEHCQVAIHKYETVDSCIKYLPEAYVRSLYDRPNVDQGWEEYKVDELPRIRQLQDWLIELSKNAIWIPDFIVIYTQLEDGNWEFMAILNFEGEIDEDRDFDGMAIQGILQEVLGNPECVWDFYQMGQGRNKLVVHESY